MSDSCENLYYKKHDYTVTVSADTLEEAHNYWDKFETDGFVLDSITKKP
jgi:hypothetical protein